MTTSRDPHAVLGVEPGASQATIKAAWRRLARTHHPDLATDDPTAARRATRRMAEINAAYEALRRDDGGPGPRRASDGRATADRATRTAGPPPPPRSRPVTGRLDTSGTVRPRNATTTPPSAHHPLRGMPGPRAERVRREPPRASTPTGPLERGRLRRYRRPPVPCLEDALALVIEFGKFRGHTLGQIAAFEPSYIDWLARTITRDRELVVASRVIQDDLDRRGVVRRHRTSAPAPPET